MVNNCIELHAHAKLNLTLEVLGRRQDGYHELRSVMHSISLYDRIIIKPNGDDAVRVASDIRLPENNTAYTAAMRYRERTGCGGVDIFIYKNIPSEAGLGGASADAAGVLMGMNKLFGVLPEAEMHSIGRRVGADVPFCLCGGCALAEGIGEKLTRLPSIKLSLLLVKGRRGISTAGLFRTFDEKNAVFTIAENHSQRLISEGVQGRLHNDLMALAIGIAPEIEDYRRRLIACGALDALMTGSGSAVYGVFESEARAMEASEAFGDCEFRKVVTTVADPWRKAIS